MICETWRNTAKQKLLKLWKLQKLSSTAKLWSKSLNNTVINSTFTTGRKTMLRQTYWDATGGKRRQSPAPFHRKHLGSTFLPVPHAPVTGSWLKSDCAHITCFPVLIPWGSRRELDSAAEKRIWVPNCWVPQFRSLQAKLANSQFWKLCNFAAFCLFRKDRCFTSGSSS